MIEKSAATGACGAVGSALPWHGRGRGFESPQVHHLIPSESVTSSKARGLRPLAWVRYGHNSSRSCSVCAPSALGRAPNPLRGIERNHLIQGWPPLRFPKNHCSGGDLGGRLRSHLHNTLPQSEEDHMFREPTIVKRWIWIACLLAFGFSFLPASIAQTVVRVHLVVPPGHGPLERSEAIGTTTRDLRPSQPAEWMHVQVDEAKQLPATKRCVSTTLRHQAREFTDFSPLTPAAC